jgi:anaerobic selenocysteine-containing dehydrogenase
VPCSWDDAFALIGRHLQALDSPHQAEFYTSGRTPNEAAFLYSIFVREFGTNNFPDCSNMCHEPTSRGLPPAIGVGKGTIVLQDFEHAEAIFVIGQNTGTNSPRMMSNLVEARKRGIPIVAVNPMPERADPLRRAAGRGADGHVRFDRDHQRVRAHPHRRRPGPDQGHDEGDVRARGAGRARARP